MKPNVPSYPCLPAILCVALAGSLLIPAANLSATNTVATQYDLSSLSLPVHAPILPASSSTPSNETPAYLARTAASVFVKAPAITERLASMPSGTAQERTGLTTDDNVNLRSGPGTDYRVLAQLPVDTPAQVLDEQAGWYHILTPWGAAGWVSTGLLKISQSSSTNAQPQVIGSAGTVGVVNMRSGPGTGYSVLARLNDSTVLEVLALQGAWYKVRSPSGTTGWVAAQYVPLDWIPDVYGGTGTPSAPAASRDIVRIAQSYLGDRYVWGGSDPGGFDCSGLTWYVYRQVGVSLPGGSVQQFSSRYGRFIGDMNALAPGDLVFFERTTEEAGITHVGIYAGAGKMIAARSERLGVRYVSLLDPFWSSRFVGGIRPYR